MAPPKDCGMYVYNAERTARVLAANPLLSDAVRRRIEGKPPIFDDAAAFVRAVPKPRAAPAPVSPESIQLPRRIVNAVCEAWDVSPVDVYSKSRYRRHVFARFAAFLLTRKLLNWSKARVGREFARDHTTVMAGLLRAQSLYADNAEWRQRFDTVTAQLATTVLVVPSGSGTGMAGMDASPAPAAATSNVFVLRP